MSNKTFIDCLEKEFPELPAGKCCIDIAKYNKSGHCEYNAYLSGISELAALRIFAFVVVHYPEAQVEVTKKNKRYESQIVKKREYKEVIYWEEVRKPDNGKNTEVYKVRT